MEWRITQFRNDDSGGGKCHSIFLCLKGGFTPFFQLLLGASHSFLVWKLLWWGEGSYSLSEFLNPFHRPLTIFGQSLGAESIFKGHYKLPGSYCNLCQ